MLTIDNERCIQCGDCLAECYMEALSVNDDDQVVFDASKCSWCGHCLALCPRDCIIIDGDGYDCMDVEDLGFAAKPNDVMLRNMFMKRRSVRQFTDDEVSEQELDKILEAGKYSPTHMNAQNNAFLVVTSPDKRAELLEDTVSRIEAIYDQLKTTNPKAAEYGRTLTEKYRADGTDNVFYNAPVVIYVFSDDEIDGALAASNMMYIAQSMQLGVCLARIPVRAFQDEEMRSKWSAPEGRKCVIALLVGNPVFEYFSSVPRKTPPVVKF